MDAVLSNRDLVRHLLATSTDTTPLLQTSKSLRHLEPCADQFEQWAERGCPAKPTPEQQPCLDALGGATSPFCVGSYSLTALDSDGFPVHSTDITPSRLARRVDAILTQRARPRVATILVISWSRTTIRLQRSASNNSLLVVNQGRRQRVRCRLRETAPPQLLDLVTHVGYVHLPCPATPVRVPRSIHVRCHRYNELTEEDFLLFTANRQ